MIVILFARIVGICFTNLLNTQKVEYISLE